MISNLCSLPEWGRQEAHEDEVCELNCRVLTFSLVLGLIHLDNGVKYIC